MLNQKTLVSLFSVVFVILSQRCAVSSVLEFYENDVLEYQCIPYLETSNPFNITQCKRRSNEEVWHAKTGPALWNMIIIPILNELIMIFNKKNHFFCKIEEK